MALDRRRSVRLRRPEPGSGSGSQQTGQEKGALLYYFSKTSFSIPSGSSPRALHCLQRSSDPLMCNFWAWDEIVSKSGKLGKSRNRRSDSDSSSENRRTDPIHFTMNTETNLWDSTLFENGLDGLDGLRRARRTQRLHQKPRTKLRRADIGSSECYVGMALPPADALFFFSRLSHPSHCLSPSPSRLQVPPGFPGEWEGAKKGTCENFLVRLLSSDCCLLSAVCCCCRPLFFCVVCFMLQCISPVCSQHSYTRDVLTPSHLYKLTLSLRQ